MTCNLLTFKLSEQGPLCEISSPPWSPHSLQLELSGNRGALRPRPNSGAKRAGRLTCASLDPWIEGKVIFQALFHAYPRISSIWSGKREGKDHLWGLLHKKAVFPCRWWIGWLQARIDLPRLVGIESQQWPRAPCTLQFHSCCRRILCLLCHSLSKQVQSLWLSN